MIENGVTSLPEAWDGDPLSSQNHCMLGHIQEWFMSGLVGINQEEYSVGFERIVIRPAVPQGLEKVSGYYESVRGRIESAWVVDGDSFRLRVTIPANATARVYFPRGYVSAESKCLEQASKAGVIAVECVDGCSVLRIGSGEYNFEAKRETINYGEKMKIYKKISFLAISIMILALSSVAFGEQDRLILNVEEFDVVGDGKTDDGPALRRLFEKASSLSRPTKIVFQKGASYYLGKEEHHAVGSMFLDRAEDVIVEGNRSLLIVDPHRRPFEVYRSKNVTIRNFQIDYSPLPYTQGRITKIENNKGYLEFQVDEGFPQPYVRDDSYYVDGRVSDCTTINGENLKFYQGHSRISSVKGLGKGTYAVTYRMHRQNKARVGDYFVMKVWPPSMERFYNSGTEASEYGEHYISNYANIQLNFSDSVTIENIISYASPKMTVCARSCSDLVIRGLVITRRPGRVLASCSDGIHLKGNERQPLIENCYIEGTLDDSIHIKISGDLVGEVASARKVRITHMDTRDNTNLGEGKTVMVFDPVENRQLAMAEIVKFESINHRSGWATLDQDVEGMKVGTRFYLQAENEAIIQNCQFGTQLQRAILTHQPTTVRNCAILDNGKGLDQGLSTGGIEGPPSQRVIFDNVSFQDLSSCALSVDCPSKDYDQLGSPQLIVKNCLFNLSKGIPALNIKNSNGVSMEGNRFGYQNEKPEESSSFKMHNTELMNFRNNQFNAGWFAIDRDGDGLADALEPAGDADHDGLQNKLDPDSNNNGIGDFEEFKLARNPFEVSR